MERLLIKLSLLWIAITLIQMHGYKGCLEKERIGLLEIKAFFKSVGNWKIETILVSWVDDKMSNCCGWEEVKCNATTGHVVELSLNNIRQSSYKNFTDGYPTLNLSLFHPFEELQSLDLSENHFEGWYENKAYDGFGSLKQLKTLNLSNSYFHSSLLYLNTLTSLTTLILQSAWLKGIKWEQDLASLKNLKVLDLSSNRINSSLSSLGLENLGKLEMLDLSDNRISTSLTELGICRLNNLIELDLSNNKFDGLLPQCLSNLTHLKVLDLSSNQLSGNFPSVMANLTSLEYLSLSYNNFEGLFSFSSLANLSKLEVFLLSPQSNMFQVVNETWLPTYQLKVLYSPSCSLYLIPSFLQNQYNLRFIDLSHNNLVGKFPTWLLQNNTKLETIYLQNNSFTGILQIPNSKHDLVNLDISSNNFSGQLPKNIGTILPMMEFINMSKNSFGGSLSSSMGEMRNLYFLDLSSNNFTAELPTHFVTGCYSLEFLILTNNQFKGQIFPQYMNLTLLEILYLDNNHFSKVGDGLMKATGLLDLDISNNKIHGQIPHWIGNFSSLWTLLMSKNLLEGDIPIQLNNLKNLYIFDISENRLSGPIAPLLNLSSIAGLFMQKNILNGSIPNSLFESSSLMISDLRDNEFSGSIMQQINEDSNMHVLLLRGNNLEGHIPNQLCQLRKLSILDLSHNRFNGSIPSCFINMLFWMSGLDYNYELAANCFFFGWSATLVHDYYNSNLDLNAVFPEYKFIGRQAEVDFMTKNRYDSYKGDILDHMSGLDLSSNELTGQVPSEIGDLKEIHALNLSHNFLSGAIPESFSHLKMIESLDLSYNRLSGRIPTQLIELNYLAIFNASYNNLSGPIPDQGQFANFDESNYGGNPSLCGPLIKKTCTTMLPSSPSKGEEQEEESAIDTVAFYWSFVAAYVTMVLGLVVILWINSYWRRSWFYFIDVCIDSCSYWFSKYVF